MFVDSFALINHLVNLFYWLVRTTNFLLSHVSYPLTCRSEISEALRKKPYQVNMLIGGYDRRGPSLFFLDYMGTDDIS